MIPLSEFSEEEEEEEEDEMFAETALSGEEPMTLNEFLVSVGEEPDDDDDLESGLGLRTRPEGHPDHSGRPGTRAVRRVICDPLPPSGRSKTSLRLVTGLF